MSSITKIRDRALATGLNTVLPLYSKVAARVTELSETSVGRSVVTTAGKGIGIVSPVLDRILHGKDEPPADTGSKAADWAEDIPTIVGSEPLATTPSGAPIVGVEVPTLDGLARAGYDSLPAERVVAKLEGLTQSELAAIFAFEKANEARSNVLEAIEGRLVDLPLPMYDSLEIPAILDTLETLSVDELKTLRDYESSTKNRFPVVGKIDSLLT